MCLSFSEVNVSLLELSSKSNQPDEFSKAYIHFRLTKVSNIPPCLKPTSLIGTGRPSLSRTSMAPERDAKADIYALTDTLTDEATIRSLSKAGEAAQAKRQKQKPRVTHETQSGGDRGHEHDHKDSGEPKESGGAKKGSEK